MTIISEFTVLQTIPELRQKLEASSVEFSEPISGICRLSTGFSELFLVLGLGSIAEFHAVLRAYY